MGIVLINHDGNTKEFTYRNPALSSQICVTSYDDMEKARKSYGTDEDTIFVNSLRDSRTQDSQKLSTTHCTDDGKYSDGSNYNLGAILKYLIPWSLFAIKLM